MIAAGSSSGITGGCIITSAAPTSFSEEDRLTVFPQGVGSGDPTPETVLLWTRVACGDETCRVDFELATDEAFTAVVASETIEASSDADHTVRIRVEGLIPSSRYYYRFSAKGVTSWTGHTRTAPAPDDDTPVRFAVASCQEYVGRRYHAYRALVEDPEGVDFVLFLGDYIYENQGDARYQDVTSSRNVNLPDGLKIGQGDDGSPVLAARTLADYRALYETYRSDADLREAHRLFPWIIIWDDHEFTNDAWQDVANEFDDDGPEERDTARREAATQAWFEYLPVDVSYDPSRGFPNDIVTYRRVRWGRHLELFLTDQRYYRDDHLVPEGQPEPSVGKFGPGTLGSRVFAIKEGFDPLEAQSPPTMLGEEQRTWLVDGILESDATWKTWGSALLVSQMLLDLTAYPDDLPGILQRIWYFKLDHWDGFRTERREILESVAGVNNFVVLSGDLHGWYTAELRPDHDDPTTPAMGVEFTVSSISSISLQEQVDTLSDEDPTLASFDLTGVTGRFDEALSASNPHFDFVDSATHGLAVVTVSDASMEVEYWQIDDVRPEVYTGLDRKQRFRVVAGSNAIVRS